MPYRLHYTCNIDFVPAGRGLGLDNLGGPGDLAGPAQTLGFFGVAGKAVSATYTSGDITTLLAAMSADLSTQLNAVIPRVQAFASGGG